MKYRTLKLIENYTPCPSVENDELFPNGIFVFNISTITNHILSGQLVVKQDDICIEEWCKTHYKENSFDEKYLKTVNLEKPVIQAEISPGNFNIIDGNHRLEKAYREKVEFIKSYKLHAEQLIPYFITLKGYQSFVAYWNSKIQDLNS